MSGLPSVNGWFAQGKGTVCAGQRDGLSGVNFCHPALDAGSMSLRIPFVIPHSMRDPYRCGVILEEVLFYWSYTHSFCNGFCQIERWKDDGVQDGSFSFGMDNATDGTRSDGTIYCRKPTGTSCCCCSCSMPSGAMLKKHWTSVVRRSSSFCVNSMVAVHRMLLVDGL